MRKAGSERMWLEFWEAAWRASEHGQARASASHRALTLPVRSPNGRAVIMHTIRNIVALDPLSSRQPGTPQSSRLEAVLHVFCLAVACPSPGENDGPTNLNLRPQQKVAAMKASRLKKLSNEQPPPPIGPGQKTSPAASCSEQQPA